MAQEREGKRKETIPELWFYDGKSFPSFPTARSEANKLKHRYCAKALKEYKQMKFRDLLFLSGSELWDK